MMGFEGKVALITGSSSGIGADAARHLASLGAKVALVGRNVDRLNEVHEQIVSSGSPIPLKIIADVTTDAERIVTETINHFGGLDILVNSAAPFKYDNVSTIEMSEFETIYKTLLGSELTQLCAPHLEKTRGNIVNVSSVNGMIPNNHAISCSVTKAALDHFTKCAALDLSSKGIRINAINPSVIRTPQLATVGFSTEEIQKKYSEWGKAYPVDRIGEVSDTSRAIAFLASDKSASFLTGILLPVDGGRSIGLIKSKL